MKRRLIVGILTCISLTKPVVTMASTQSTKEIIQEEEHKKENEAPRGPREEGKKHHEQDLIDAYKGEEKKEFERVIKERREIKKEMKGIWETKSSDKKNSKDEMVKFIEELKGRVEKGELTKEEAVEIIKDKRIADEEFWNSLSDEGKKEIEEVNEKIKKLCPEIKALEEQLNTSITEGNKSKIKDSEKKYINAMKEQNKLLKQKLEIMRKHAKK